jgi:hypothetical protein
MSLIFRSLGLILMLCLSACAAESAREVSPLSQKFTIAVIPDTQNYLDYKHQSDENFALDGSDLFIAQMKDISSREDVAFVASVGDVWQHQTLAIDSDHADRGLVAIANPFFSSELAPTEKALTVEIPKAVEGYKILSKAGIPFGVAPGNHDYDAMWSADGYPPQVQKNLRDLTMTPEDVGILHIGGLDNFRSVFGSEGEFFKDKPWYVASYRGGANAAQVFNAGGYRFLHITLEMAADDWVLSWASEVIEAHPHYPTIITTHDYLNTDGERQANPLVDLKRIDPDHHNTAEEVWQKLVSAYDQVFMVLSGHHHGQARRVDQNHYGHRVYQLLSNYQGRGQAGLDAGQPLRAGRGTPSGLGDGWYRLMQFDMSSEVPTVSVKTFSSHYRKLSSELASYAQWYRPYEQPTYSDSQFLQADEFVLELNDFRQRFGPPKTSVSGARFSGYTSPD